MLHLIVKQLQLSETLNKIVGDIKRLEEQVGKVLMGRPPPPVMHNKSDLEKDIDGLKVSLLYKVIFFCYIKKVTNMRSHLMVQNMSLLN